MVKWFLGWPSELQQITCVMSSLCFPWRNNIGKMLSNKVWRLFPFLWDWNQHFQSISSTTYEEMDACIIFVKLNLDFPVTSRVVVTLRSCVFLWKCRVCGSVFFKEIHLHDSLLNTGGGGCQWKLSYCWLNFRVFSGLFNSISELTSSRS